MCEVGAARSLVVARVVACLICTYRHAAQGTIGGLRVWVHTPQWRTAVCGLCGCLCVRYRVLDIHIRIM